MTIKKLKDILSKYPDEMEIIFNSTFYNVCSVNEFSIETPEIRIGTNDNKGKKDCLIFYIENS